MPKTASADLRDRRFLVVSGPGRAVQQVLAGLLGHPYVGAHGQGGDAAEHGDGDGRPSGPACSRRSSTWLAEGGHAVADGLDAGERGAAGGEGAKQQEDEGEAGQALVPARTVKSAVGAAWCRPMTRPR